MKDIYTIVIMSSVEGEVRQYSIRCWFLKFLYLLFFVIVAGAVGGVGYGIHWQSKLHTSKEENKILTAEKQNLESELKSEQEYLRQEMQRIQEMADVVSKVLGIDQQKGILGQGGNGSEVKESDGSKHPNLVSEAELVFIAGASEDTGGNSRRAQISKLKNDVKRVHKHVMAEVEKYNQRPSILPILVTADSKTKTYWYSSGFGTRTDPLTKQRKPHYGVDISTHKNTSIIAAADGVISKIQKRRSGLGKVIWIRHKATQTETVYGHMNKFADGMSRGKKVKRGEVIGYVGNSGRSTGPHLHYGVYVKGKPVNPMNNYILGEWGHQPDSDVLK